jgi:hypothetical protein
MSPSKFALNITNAFACKLKIYLAPLKLLQSHGDPFYVITFAMANEIAARASKQFP